MELSAHQIKMSDGARSHLPGAALLGPSLPHARGMIDLRSSGKCVV